MNTHLNFVIKRALHFSTLVIKTFNSSTKLKLLPNHHEPVFFRMLRHSYDKPTFKTKTPHLASNVQHINAFCCCIND